MAEYNQFQDTKQAIGMAKGLQDVENYKNPIGVDKKKYPMPSAATMAGLDLSNSQADKMRMPIISEDDQYFAQKLLNSRDEVLTAPASIPKNSIIEFSDDQGETTSGLVIEPPGVIAKKAVYVRTLSQAEAKAYQQANPSVHIMGISQKDLKKINEVKEIKNTDSQHMPKAIAFYDPIQRIFFNAIKGSLKVNYKGKEIEVDPFFSRFFTGVIFLVILIIIFYFFKLVIFNHG